MLLLLIVCLLIVSVVMSCVLFYIPTISINFPIDKTEQWIFLTVIFFILLVIYFATSKLRAKAKAERYKKQKQKMIDKYFAAAEKRFGESNLANAFVKSFSDLNWQCVECYQGCGIYTDKIKVGNNSVKFHDYGFENISTDDCKLLAYYLGKAYGKPFIVEEIMSYYSKQKGYSGNIDRYGNINVTPDYNTSETLLGYYLYAESTIKKKEQVLNKW